MTNLRLIKIVQVANGTVEFHPATAGMNGGDRIHWNNETDEEHWLERTEPTGFLTDNIPAGQVSNPGVVVQDDERINYRCKLHPQETGTIVAVALAPAIVAASALTATAASAGKAKAPRAGSRKKTRRKKTSRGRTG